MKRVLVVLVIFLGMSTAALAAPYYFLEPPEQYAALPISGDPEIKTEYYGELVGYPNLYEMSVGMPFSLTLELRQPHSGTPIPYSLTVIEVIEEGQVREVASLRTAQAPDAWQRVRDHFLGLSVLKGARIERDLPPGRYQIEVNTPDNLGRYALVVGHRNEGIGWWGNWQRVVFANTFFGSYIFFWFTSLFVLPQLIVVAIVVNWWRRRKRRNMYA